MSGGIYSFGRFRLDSTERRLFDGEQPVQLAPKVFDTLRLLVENCGRVVSKKKMLDEVWEGSFVEENNLAQNISLLRRLLGENNSEKFIETVPKFGYRFVCPVTGGGVTTEVFERSQGRIFVDGSDTAATVLSGLPGTTPVTQYAANGDVNIAYQVLGTGPIDIVFVMGWVSHLEYFWKHHTFASFLEKLASFSRLILFDKRGTGLSDRVPINELPTLEQRMEDVHAVMNAVGSERAVLVGVSEGGPMCSLFAATYPERTAGLVMIGTYAKRIRDDDYPWAPTEEQRNAFFDLMRREWGGPVGIAERAPTLADDAEFSRWWAEYLRMGASPGAAVALTQMNAEIDVREVLPLVRVPTLVIHRSGDACLKVEEGRYVAARIPGAEYVELDGVDHLPFVGDQDAVINEIDRFVANVRLTDEYDRVLATVLCVLQARDSAETKAPGADGSNAPWKAFIDKQLTLFRGREVFVDADETLAAFDGPARAIRCATAINEAARSHALPLRIGLHTGECDIREDRLGGVAVDLARAVAAGAEPGEILVSRTVKDLVAGSGLRFKEFGTRVFDGIEGEWRLFTVQS